MFHLKDDVIKFSHNVLIENVLPFPICSDQKIKQNEPFKPMYIGLFLANLIDF